MKITPEIRAAILSGLGSNRTHADIAASIKASFGVEIERSSITKLAKRARTERAETAKVVLREKIGDELTRDLQQIAKNQERLEKFLEVAYENAIKFPEEYKPFLSSLGELRALIEMKFRHSGANEPENVGASTLADILGAALAAENAGR